MERHGSKSFFFSSFQALGQFALDINIHLVTNELPDIYTLLFKY